MPQARGVVTLRAAEWKTIAEGTPEKVRTCRRGKAPLLRRMRVGGVGRHRKLLALQHAHTHQLSDVGASPLQTPPPQWPKATCHPLQTGPRWLQEASCQPAPAWVSQAWPPLARSHLLACHVLGFSGRRKLLSSPPWTGPLQPWEAAHRPTPCWVFQAHSPRGQKQSPPWTGCVQQWEAACQPTTDQTCRWWEQTTAVLPGSRGGRGPPPLGISEQKSLAVPTTSEGITEKDNTTEQHLMLLSFPQENTHPAAATAKCSGQCLDS